MNLGLGFSGFHVWGLGRRGLGFEIVEGSGHSCPIQDCQFRSEQFNSTMRDLAVGIGVMQVNFGGGGVYDS